jgi:hypothetical protein
MPRFLVSIVVALLTVHAPQSAFAHGGVVEEEDLCVIKVNYLRGHFKIYQPLIDGHEEYCEDLPNATESVFVMEYLHDSLAKAAVDFRIIRDVTGQGRFARWEDVAQLENLEAATVFYRAPTVDPDVLTVIHEFEEEGHFIGIVTANVDGEDQIYRAVFPFEVGYTGLGYWPFFIALLLAIQIQYLVMSGRFKRWRGKRTTAAALLILLFPWPDALAEGWVSERGVYIVTFESSIEPITINRMHTWTLTVSSQGNPVTGAALEISGGMPKHDHGMPTRPRVTEELGDGMYRLGGMRFHMNGTWEVVIAINADGRRDSVVITLEL